MLVFVKRVEERREPIPGDLSVVVQEEKVPSFCDVCATIASTDESQILLVADINEIRDTGQNFFRPIHRRIVYDDDFIRNTG